MRPTTSNTTLNAEPHGAQTAAQQRVKGADFALLCRELKTLVQAGMTVVEALAIGRQWLGGLQGMSGEHYPPGRHRHRQVLVPEDDRAAALAAAPSPNYAHARAARRVFVP